MSEMTFCVSREDYSRQFAALDGHEAWGALQTGLGRFAAESPLVRVHRHSGSDVYEPTFVLVAGADSPGVLCTVTPQAGAAHPRTMHAVHDGAGALLGRIVQERSPLGIRRAWRLEDAVRQRSAVAYKGNVLGWAAYWAFSPFWVLLALVLLVYGDLRPGESLWSKPHRTRWRVRSGSGRRKVALDFRTGRYRADSGLVDVRLLYAQAALYGA